MYGPYPFPPFYPQMNNPVESPVKQLKQMIRFYKKMEQEEKGDKKGDKKKESGYLKSPFTTVQWLIILCTFGPITVPWYILGVINSWDAARIAIKATLGN